MKLFQSNEAYAMSQLRHPHPNWSNVSARNTFVALGQGYP